MKVSSSERQKGKTHIIFLLDKKHRVPLHNHKTKIGTIISFTVNFPMAKNQLPWIC